MSAATTVNKSLAVPTTEGANKQESGKSELDQRVDVKKKIIWDDFTRNGICNVTRVFRSEIWMHDEAWPTEDYFRATKAAGQLICPNLWIAEAPKDVQKEVLGREMSERFCKGCCEYHGKKTAEVGAAENKDGSKKAS